MKCAGGYGREIPCVYKFTGQPRKVDMLNKLLVIVDTTAAPVLYIVGQ